MLTLQKNVPHHCYMNYASDKLSLNALDFV